MQANSLLAQNTPAASRIDLYAQIIISNEFPVIAGAIERASGENVVQFARISND